MMTTFANGIHPLTGQHQSLFPVYQPKPAPTSGLNGAQEKILVVIKVHGPITMTGIRKRNPTASTTMKKAIDKLVTDDFVSTVQIHNRTHFIVTEEA